MDEFFSFFEKKLETLFLTLVGITWVKGTTVIEQIDAKKRVCAVGGVTPHPPSLTSKNPPDRIYPRKKTIQ